MPQNAVLDKGVILGYCFFSDPHHTRCVQYLDFPETDYYTTKEIEDIFEIKKDNIINRHRKAILRHVQLITDEYDEELTEEDIERIQSRIDRRSNDAWRYLLDFYQGKEGETVYQIARTLRSIVRDMEQRAEERRETLYPHLLGWLRIDAHEDIQDELEPLRRRDEEDFWICIDAHDIAANVTGETELATNNPSDFGHADIEDLILEVTAIDNIEYIFVSLTYEPGE